MAWHLVTPLEKVPPGTGGEFVVAERIVALFNVAGEIQALDGICPHQGGPLGKGKLTGCIVTCPWHGWQFDVSSGQHQSSKSLQHPKFGVKIENQQIFVDLPET